MTFEEIVSIYEDYIKQAKIKPSKEYPYELYLSQKTYDLLKEGKYEFPDYIKVMIR